MTRHSCTQCFNITGMCKQYNCKSHNAGLHEATDSTAVTASGWEAETLPKQLGSANNRQMGVRHSEGVSDSLNCAPSSGVLSKHSYIFSRAKPANASRSKSPSREWGCPSMQPSTSRDFLFNSLPSSKERGSNEASHKPQEIERVGSPSALQDGGHGDTQRTVEGKRLDGEGGSQRCLLHNSDAYESSVIPEVHAGERTLSVHLPTIRPLLCPMGIHQSDEAHSYLPSEHGSSHDCLHRRHSANGGFTRPSGESPQGLDILVDRSGVCHQYTQVNYYTIPTDRVSGAVGELIHPTVEPTRREAPQYQVGDRTNEAEASHHSKTTGSTNRETPGSIASSFSCPPVLPVSSRRPTECFEHQSTGLQFTAVPISASSGGVSLVAGETSPMEWQSSAAEAGDRDYQVRCLTPRLGCSMQGLQDRWTLEQFRTRDAYKLPGVTGSHAGGAVLHEGSVRSIYTSSVGQPDSCSIYQQYGGHGFTPVDESVQSPMDVGPFQRYCSVGGVYSGRDELCGGCRVQNHAGSGRLETSFPDLQCNQSGVRSPGSGPVCISPVHPTPTVFQLEARSSGGGNRCLQPAVGTVQRVCKPSMVSDREGSQSSKKSTSSGGPGGPSMEGPTVVPSAAGVVTQLPTTASSVPGSVPVDIQQGSDGSSTSTGRVAYLRQKFGCRNLSESAKELLLTSWRSKTSQAYDSHFKKWLGWCTERGCDPVSGPVSDVVNFLADLHSQGYQTSSLNAYRSAISSVHDRVDDMDVGKHPLVARLLKGAFHARPPLPRYTGTWDVQIVLDNILQWGDTNSLSLKLLTFKLVMLMSLARPSRSSDLASLCIDNYHYMPEGVTFLPSSLAKQSRQGKPLTDFFFASFPDNNQLCPVETLRQYLRITASLRKETNRLFVAIVKPHKPVAPCTIARWLKEVLKLSGIDVNIFTAHSTRGASSSAAASAGITINDILKAADWSTESVFRKFYYRPTHSPSFGRAVLASTSHETR